MLNLLYNILIHFYGILIRLNALTNTKAELWVKGRKNLFRTLEKKLAEPAFAHPNRKLIWFHCASLGEFEQGRPVIEAFKQQHPDYLILLTFFSPSGYEVRKQYPMADYITYLPLDTKAHATRFVEMVKPDLVVFVKYEFWFNILNVLKNRNIPTFLISAIFRRNQYFFTWYGSWAVKWLKSYKHIFVQDSESKLLLKTSGIQEVTISGDTRFDRVKAISSASNEIALVSTFTQNHTVLIAGSTWPADEELLVKLLDSSLLRFRIIIAPHEISTSHIEQLRTRFGTQSILLSEADEVSLQKANVLIVNSIGLLSGLYAYGTMAYIGGGFGQGIHNILEPAAFGLPVVFGPNYQKFREAKELISLGGAFTIQNYDELGTIMQRLCNNNQALTTASQTCLNYVSDNCGATQTILNFLHSAV
jgi:3-deoxy-D-manno-octulosonic-acid transferase